MANTMQSTLCNFSKTVGFTLGKTCYMSEQHKISREIQSKANDIISKQYTPENLKNRLSTNIVAQKR